MRAKLLTSPSPALRERVPSAARRVRVPRRFVYRSLLLFIYAQAESTPTTTVLDRCRKADVVCIARSAFTELQISEAASDRPARRRFRLHQARVGDRSRWRSAYGDIGRCAPNCSTRKTGLASDPLLEQRCSREYQWRDRDNFGGSQSRIDPHPPSPVGWVPPSPAVRERGYCLGL